MVSASARRAESMTSAEQLVNLEAEPAEALEGSSSHKNLAFQNQPMERTEPHQDQGKRKSVRSQQKAVIDSNNGKTCKRSGSKQLMPEPLPDQKYSEPWTFACRFDPHLAPLGASARTGTTTIPQVLVALDISASRKGWMDQTLPADWPSQTEASDHGKQSFHCHLEQRYKRHR